MRLGQKVYLALVLSGWIATVAPTVIAQESVTLQGAGATFPAPLYQRWFSEYNKLHPEVRINYQALGSGAGVKQFQDGLVNFGASDAAELMQELKKKYTIAIVTHNLQQAKRVADMTAFLYVDTSGGGRTGYLVEYGQTEQIFEDPKQKYTKDYLRGEFS